MNDQTKGNEKPINSKFWMEVSFISWLKTEAANSLIMNECSCIMLSIFSSSFFFLFSSSIFEHMFERRRWKNTHISSNDFETSDVSVTNTFHIPIYSPFVPSNSFGKWCAHDPAAVHRCGKLLRMNSIKRKWEKDEMNKIIYQSTSTLFIPNHHQKPTFFLLKKPVICVYTDL